MSKRGSSRRLIRGQTWRLVETARGLALEPQPPYVLIVALAVGGVVWLLLAAGVMYTGRASVCGLMGLLFVGGILFGGAAVYFTESRAERRLGAWLIEDQSAGLVHLPRMNRIIPVAEVRAVLEGPRGSRLSRQHPRDTLYLGVTTPDGSEVLAFFEPERGQVLTWRRGVQSPGRRLAEALAAHFDVPLHRLRGADLCTRCEYDLTGTRAAGRETCPECGERLTPWAVARPVWTDRDKRTFVGR